MMELSRIYLFCSLTNSVFVERGTHGGTAGYWFADNRTHQRLFLTGEQIESALCDGDRELDHLAPAAGTVPEPALAAS